MGVMVCEFADPLTLQPQRNRGRTPRPVENKNHRALHHILTISRICINIVLLWFFRGDSQAKRETGENPVLPPQL
jgi:hypothetical protein